MLKNTYVWLAGLILAIVVACRLVVMIAGPNHFTLIVTVLCLALVILAVMPLVIEAWEPKHDFVFMVAVILAVPFGLLYDYLADPTEEA